MSVSHGITAIPGIRVGHWTDPVGLTGCTVVDLPEPNVVAAEVRGGAPGSRELALLAPGMRVEQAQAILLTGGSAFGLAAADGVMSALEAAGRGHPTPAARVPIVPAAVVYDLMVGDPLARPGPAEGRAAFESAHAGPVEVGGVGAGMGCTVAKWRGSPVAAGVGSGLVEGAGFGIGALAVVNAVGDVFTLEGEALTGGTAVPGPPAPFPDAGTNTTLVVVATDARLTRAESTRLAVRAHDALGACLRPAHTRVDGDVVFTVSCGDRRVDVDLVAEAAFVATGRAVADAVTSRRG